MNVTATCKHCRKPIVRCDSLPDAHAGCSSGYGWIHSDPQQWGHSCRPRSGSPYAQPDVREQAREDVRQMWEAAFGHEP